jgi:excisionase family DNA binding protein
METIHATWIKHLNQFLTNSLFHYKEANKSSVTIIPRNGGSMCTLDIDECALFLKVNRTTALELAASGALPGAKIGRAWVFLKDDLVEYLRNAVRVQQRERQAANETEPQHTVVVRPVQLRERKKTPPVLPELRSQI